MNKVVLLPLDERPCNYEFPQMLFHNEQFQMVRPLALGDKKQPADASKILSFLRSSCKDADYLVLSMDMLLYGGLIPSRLHQLDEPVVQQRLDFIRELKQTNRKLKIYAFQCIMRCPKYSSSDEEPDYYEICGAEIHKIGVYRHKMKLGMEKQEKLNYLYDTVNPEYLKDYLDRRSFNMKLNLQTMEYVKEGFIDLLILPQDDSAQYGFTAMDQEVIYQKLTSLQLQDKVYMYPGADELALTILSRVMNEINRNVPGVYIKYAAIKAPYMIPAYEDRPLGETLKYHIMAAGCCQVAAESEADIILAVTAPANKMEEATNQPAGNADYRVERNLTELVYYMEHMIKLGKIVTIGDNAYANGADLELIGMLNNRGLLMKVAGYAGWNTSSNTIGTAVAQGVQYYCCGKSTAHRDFLALRYVEDAGYCSVVRKYMKEYELTSLGMNNFDVKEAKGIVSSRVHELLCKFVEDYLPAEAEHIEIVSVVMPWRRMFEVGVKVRFKGNRL